VRLIVQVRHPGFVVAVVVAAAVAVVAAAAVVAAVVAVAKAAVVVDVVAVAVSSRLFWILNGCGSCLGLGFWILALAGIAQMICSFVVVRVVVAVAVVVVVAAAVVVDNTNHVEKDFGSTDFPVEMQHFVDLGCYTKFVGGFVVASEDSVVASE